MKTPSAEIVIVGAGVIGAAIAYQLASEGIKNVLVVDKGFPAQGTTQHAAGLIGQVRSSISYTRLTMQSIAVFNELQANGFDPGWRQVGSLRFSENEQRDAHFADLISTSNRAGLDATLLKPDEIQATFPYVKTSQLRSAIWCESDGYVNPTKLTQAYLDFAAQNGASVLSGVTVHGAGMDGKSISHVKSSIGDITCSTVIDAAGVFAGQLVRPHTQNPIALTPIRHGLLITRPLATYPEYLPVMRFPDRSAYVRRHESGGVMIGGFSREDFTLNPDELDHESDYPRIMPDYDKLNTFFERIQSFLPDIETASFCAVQTAAPTCTSDGEFLIGKFDNVPNYILASGCNVHGISGSVGIAKHVCEHLDDGHVSEYTKVFDPQRFGADITRTEIRKRSQQVYANYYRLLQSVR